MKDINMSRREVLVRTCQVSAVGALLIAGGCGNEDDTVAACVDPNELSGSQKNYRASLQYTDLSPAPEKQCSGCAYFEDVGNSAGCGHCKIFNGPASATGHCTSWSPMA